MSVAKVKFDGKALKVINAIDADSDDELNNRRFSRLCGMLRSQDLVWRGLTEHGKAQIVRDAQQRLSSRVCV